VPGADGRCGVSFSENKYFGKEELDEKKKGYGKGYGRVVNEPRTKLEKEE
jgi:hypothetical protein